MNEVKRRAPHPVADAPKPVPVRARAALKTKSSHAPATRVAEASKRNVTIARGKKPAQEAREPLKKRRKQARKAVAIFLGVLATVLVGAAFYIVWLPTLRIHDVTASGPHAEEVRVVALQSTYGTHFLLVPRNSIFFIPEKDIRAAVLYQFPDIEALSISASGLNTLTIKSVPRAEVFQWCGATVELADGTCYQANAEGLVFAPVIPGLSSEATGILKIYGPLDREIGASPIRAHVAVAHRLPDVLRMTRAVEALGADVVSLGIRDDEADLYLASGTRLTYVLGREEQAAGIAASVFPQLNLADGSVAYVDLRFEGKAYYRKSAEQ
jgi:cell division septal protein FtsQ